jgi:hypothetical protein
MEHTAEKIRADKRPTIVALEATFNDLLKGVAPAADERLNALRHVVFAIFALDKSEPQAFETLEKLKPDFELLLADELDTSLKPADDVIHDSVDEDVGEGIGEILTAREGRKLLNQYAVTRPLESWAGKVASAGELQRQFDIRRNTLSEWRKRDAVIGIRKGMRNYVYPIEQFVDGAPVDGIAAVVDVAPNPRAAWLWLRQEHGALEGMRPIDLLRNDLVTSRERVALAAKRDFD